MSSVPYPHSPICCTCIDTANIRPLMPFQLPNWLTANSGASEYPTFILVFDSVKPRQAYRHAVQCCLYTVATGLQAWRPCPSLPVTSSSSCSELQSTQCRSFFP